MHVRKHRAQVPHDPGDNRKWQLVELNPLTEDAVIGESSPGNAEKLGGVQRRHPSHPRIRRLRNDHVVALTVELESAARVVDDDAHAGPGKHGAVHPDEEAVHPHDGRLELDDFQPRYARHGGKDMSRHARAIADHERGRRTNPGNRGRKAKHDLRVHVAAIGSVDLAAHAQRSTALAFPHTHGRVRPLPEGELAHAAVLEKPLLRGFVHALARVDRRTQIDQPGAPAGGRHCRHQREGPQTGGRQDAYAQPAVFRRPLRDSARGEPGEHQRRESIDDKADAQRSLGSERNDKDKSGDHRPENAADGIERVGRADIGPACRATPRREIGEERECHAHPDRGNQNDGAHRHSHQHEARGRAQIGNLEDRDDVGREESEEHEQRGGAYTGDTLREPRGRGGLGTGRAAPRDDDAAQADAEQKHEQDQREGIGRSAHEHDQHARPGDLVEQRRERGEGKKR